MTDTDQAAWPASPEFEDLLGRLFAAPFAADTTPIETLRVNFERFAESFADIDEDTEFRSGQLGDVPVEWVTAPGAAKDAAVVYLHGGGYAIGSLGGYRDMAARLSRVTGATVVTVGYRLAPENRFPAALDDCEAAVAGVIASGIDASRVALAGDSAGGGLTLSVLVRMRADGVAPLAGGVCISPLTDLTHSGDSIKERAHLDPIVTPAGSHSYGVRYLGEDGDFAHPEASPLFADLRGLPPLLIVAGTSECLLDDSVRLARRVRAAGGRVELDLWPRMVHIFPFFAAQIPEARAAMNEIGSYLAARIGTKPAGVA